MRCRTLAVLFGGVAVWAVLAGGVRAGWPWACDEDGDHRAGNPRNVACWAVPSDTGHYTGYYVGGGAPCRGEPRCWDEGTWGWDYCGLLLPKRVALQWYHGNHYQGGIGSYRVNGTKRESKSTP